jgi:beta-N-acetylhexosaminidase
MFCVGFDGYSIPPHVERLIDRGIAGVALFRRNVESPRAFAKLCADLKRRAGRPFITCIDQEGGRVMRLRDGFTDVPSMRVLGKTGDESLAYEIGKILGTEMRAVNGDLNFAPVLDVDTNPKNPVIADRSLGKDVSVVTRLGVAIARGIQERGVAACGKHFPGHGDTWQDSHYDLPHVEQSLERLRAAELPPFAAAARAGVATIMTAHVVFDAIDPKYPATMSRPILQGVLREQLGFDGAILSDDIEMKAIANHFGLEEAIVQSANAGVDLFMVCHVPEKQEQALEILIRAAERGEVQRQRIEEANRRIDVLFERFVKSPSDEDPTPRIGTAEHRAFADRVRDLAGGIAAAPAADPTEFRR